MAVETLALKDIGKEVTKPDILKNIEVHKNIDIDKPLVFERKKIPCRNSDLEGQKHPVTGVEFVAKTVTDADGNEVDVVVPVFDSKFDVQLSDENLQASDAKQFKECNEKLKDAVENDPEFAKQFTDEQLEQIKDGETPDGYVWHHNEECGKMQLVDYDTHAKTGHTGGKTIWGGGNENR